MRPSGDHPTALPHLPPASAGRSDFVLAGVALVAAIVLGLLLAREAPRAASARAMTGQVTELVGGARRRAADNVVWHTLRLGDSVHDGDAVFTGPDAAARVRLTSGGELTLEPSSLVVLTGLAGEVELRRGGLVARASEGGLRAVAASGAVMIGETGSVHLRQNPGEPAVVEVLGGSARLVTTLGEKTLTENQAGGFDRAGNLAPATTRPARLTAPESGARLFFDRNPTVPLTWQAEAGQTLVLQLGRQATFETLLIVTRVDAVAGRYLFEAPGEGVYWWRLCDAQGAPQSDARHFMVLREAAPVPIYPQAGDAVYVPPGQAMTFLWSAVPAADHYHLEVATSRDFSPLLYQRECASTELRVDEPWPEGNYHWRVRASATPERHPPFSIPTSFSLLRAPPLGVPEPIDEEIRVDGR